MRRESSVRVNRWRRITVAPGIVTRVERPLASRVCPQSSLQMREFPHSNGLTPGVDMRVYHSLTISFVAS